MLKIKLGNVLNVQSVLPKVLENTLKIKTLYNFEKLTEKLSKELEFIEKNRNEMIKKYGEELEPNKWVVKQENTELFVNELKELLDIEIELSEVEKIQIKEIEDVKLNADEYIGLKPFLNFP